MPYTADISRTNPACFLFLVDQSGSMEMALAGQPGQRKMDQAADAINRILDAVSQRCSQGLEIRDYFHIGVITYNTDSRGTPIVETAFPRTSLDQPFLLISEVVDAATVEERQVKESDGASGLVEVTRRVPVWFTPKAMFGTPMSEALEVCGRALRDWIAQHPDSFPPIVINITDGAATGRDPEALAQEVMRLGTNDVNVLLFRWSTYERFSSQCRVQYLGSADRWSARPSCPEIVPHVVSGAENPVRDLSASLD